MRLYKHDCYQSDDNKLWIKLAIQVFFFRFKKEKNVERIKVEMKWRTNLTLKTHSYVFRVSSQGKGLQSNTGKGESAKPSRLRSPGEGKYIVVSIQAPGVLPL